MDQIIFAMEDLKHECALDAERFQVIRLDEEDSPEDRQLLELPAWSSADGYRLMESFAALPAAEPLRRALHGALEQKHGVFKAFKEALGANEILLKRWHDYKREALKKRVMNWYNALREEWGLERMGEEPEETADILLEDFIFEWEEKPGSRTLIARDPGGTTAGRISIDSLKPPASIEGLEVIPEYRSMGLGSTLLEKALLSLSPQEESGLYLDVPAEFDFFSRVLSRNGFSVQRTRWALKQGLQKD
mgnify:CR=1 FL=1